ncbi:MAG: sel1 repeat family protein [Rhodospirillaceae bacterium]|nr:sel1 repeat family protein [Rhodospirillaceae bacterium]MBT5674769.1 sel1 repeat family protein [Rhodospirillaceae bacterium]
MRHVTRARFRLFSIIWALGLCLNAPVSADFDSGLSAFLNGDYRRAREIWQPLAESGDAQSQFGLGMMIEGGHGIPPDAEKASVWYLRAAGQGMTEAELSLGSLYEHGRGVARNPGRAAELYRNAAKKGNAQAQYNLAKLYLGGAGIPPNRALGIAWMQRSAAQLYGRAVQHLAMIGVALEAPESELPADESLFVDSITVPASPPPEVSEADGGEHLNILAEENQFELPLETVDAVETESKQMLKVEVPEGEYAVLLATFDREQAAGRVWQKMTMRYPKLLDGLQSKIIALELGDSGAVLWRLEAGMLASEPDAVTLCEALRRAGEYCFPLRAAEAGEK